MDRKVLIDLLQDGMEYPPGKHRLWISRCFEITVRPDKIIELDEYEQFFAEQGSSGRKPAPAPRKKDREMFHVGKSVLDLRQGKITESSGAGWQKNS